MFGELVGLWLAQCWIEQGRAKSFTLLELGPGRGTLMADILRATSKVAGFHEAMTLCLFESSDRLRVQQRETLSRYAVKWETDLLALPDLPLFFVANEFFDALPIHQYQRTGDIWLEREVVIKGDELEFSMSPMPARILKFFTAVMTSRTGTSLNFVPMRFGFAQPLAQRSKPMAERD